MLNLILIKKLELTLMTKILSLLSCSMSSQTNNKIENINKVEFKINKTTRVILKND